MPVYKKIKKNNFFLRQTVSIVFSAVGSPGLLSGTRFCYICAREKTRTFKLYIGSILECQFVDFKVTLINKTPEQPGVCHFTLALYLHSAFFWSRSFWFFKFILLYWIDLILALMVCFDELNHVLWKCKKNILIFNNFLFLQKKKNVQNLCFSKD